MANPVKAAKDRIALLKAQISELERFIEIHDRLSSGEPFDRSLPGSSSTDTLIASSRYADGNNTPQKPVDNFLGARTGRVKNRPEFVADLVERIIREIGRPLTRGEIVSALETRDVQIPYGDKARYIGTIVWRNKGKFKNIEGRGYWVTDLPVPTGEGMQSDVQQDLLE